MKRRKEGIYQTYVEQVGKIFSTHVQMKNRNIIVALSRNKNKTVELAKKLAKQNNGEYRGFNIVTEKITI